MNDGDIVGPSDRLRIRSAQEKAPMLAEVDAEGGKVRLVAGRPNISENLIFNWRSARKAAAVANGAPENVEFIPAGIIEGPVLRALPAAVSAAPEREAESGRPFASGTGRTGAIEITLPNGTRLALDASVNEKALARVLPAIKGPTCSAWRQPQRCISLAVRSICATGSMAWLRRFS